MTAAHELTQEKVLELLRSDGGRLTSARRAVVNCLFDNADHLTPDEIATDVQATLPDVSLSTVYRALEALEALGVVEHVHLGHGPARYHLANRQHVHLLCRTCNRVIEVPTDRLDPLAASLAAQHGFELEPRHFALLGRCSRCRGQGRPG